MKNKKKFMIGAYSVGLTAVVIAVVIVANLLVGQLPSTLTKLDATPDKLVTIGTDTKTVLKNVKEDVTIYHVVQEGYEDISLENILERYKDASSKIKVEKVDPLSNPTFIKKYTEATVSQNSLIVESEKRSTVIDGSYLYQYMVEMDGYSGTYMSASEYEYMNQMYQSYYGTAVPATAYFFAENEITRAIDYVSHDTLPIVYALTGHGEVPVSSGAFASVIADENVELKDLELLKGETIAVPADATALLVNVPTADISKEESDAIIKYLKEGGNVILNTYVAYYSEKNMPNLAAVCSQMGLTAEENYVFESNASGYSQYPFYLLPTATGKGITAALDSSALYTYMIESHSIKETGDRENVTCQPLLNTTDGAYFYTEQMEAEPENEDLVKNAEKAVRTLAYQSTLTDEEGNAKGNLYWFASPYFLNDSFATYGNGQLFTALLTQICEKPASVSIIGKEIVQTYLTLTEASSTVWSAVVVAIVPLSALVIGFIVWLLRRTK